MDQFLANLHKKPDHHKKRFAFLSSLTITLFIFGFWSLATFGVNDKFAATPDDSREVARESKEVGPLQSLRMNIASSFEAFKNSFNELKTGVETIDLESEYTDMRDGALETYGQQ